MCHSSVRKLFVVLVNFIFSIASCYGAYSEIGSVSGLYAMMNRRYHMEDFSVRIENECGTGFYAILDGHGGDYSSSYAKHFLTKAVVDVLRSNHSEHVRCEYAEEPNGDLNLEKMLTDFTDQMEAHLEAHAMEGEHTSGSTCLMIVAEKDKLTVGNVGDSRGVMCDSECNAIDLSVDHKAGENEDEEKRMIKANKAMRNRKTKRIHGLAVSRALGDLHFKEKAGKNVISSKPEIFTFDLKIHQPKFMILASDGLWDALSSQMAVDYIKNHYLTDTDFGAKALAERAIIASGDNITVMVVVFKNGTYEVANSLGDKVKTLQRKISSYYQNLIQYNIE